MNELIKAELERLAIDDRSFADWIDTLFEGHLIKSQSFEELSSKDKSYILNELRDMKDYDDFADSCFLNWEINHEELI